MTFHTQGDNCNNIKREIGHHTLGEKLNRLKGKSRKRPILPSFEEGSNKALMIIERHLLLMDITHTH